MFIVEVIREMPKKKKVIICIAAVLVLLAVLDCAIYPKTPPIEEWKDVCVHTSESGYWPPTDSKLDRLVIWFYLRTAIPLGTEETYINCLRKQAEETGFPVSVNVTDHEPGKIGISYQFVISPVHDNVFFDRVMFLSTENGNEATYWITLPGFWRYLDRVHTRLHQEILEGKH